MAMGGLHLTIEVSAIQEQFPLNSRGFHYTVKVSTKQERFPFYSKGFHYTVEVFIIQ